MPPDIAPMLVAIVGILTVGFIAVIRPIAKPLVRLFEAMITEREQLPAKGLKDIQRTLEGIESRLHLMEERQGFYEALRAAPDVPRLPTSAVEAEDHTIGENDGPSLVEDV